MLKGRANGAGIRWNARETRMQFNRSAIDLRV